MLPKNYSLCSHDLTQWICTPLRVQAAFSSLPDGNQVWNIGDEVQNLALMPIKVRLEYLTIHNLFSSSLARRSPFCKFQDNLDISFIDTNGDLGNMSHVGHLRTTPGSIFFLIVQFHKCHKCQTPNITHGTFSVKEMDYSFWMIPARTDPKYANWTTLQNWHILQCIPVFNQKN